jgi:hypothetical protein
MSAKSPSRERIMRSFPGCLMIDSGIDSSDRPGVDLGAFALASAKVVSSYGTNGNRQSA